MLVFLKTSGNTTTKKLTPTLLMPKWLIYVLLTYSVNSANISCQILPIIQ